MGDVLTIRARREEEHQTKKRNFLHREFKYGAIERLVNLPKGRQLSPPFGNTLRPRQEIGQERGVSMCYMGEQELSATFETCENSGQDDTPGARGYALS